MTNPPPTNTSRLGENVSDTPESSTGTTFAFVSDGGRILGVGELHGEEYRGVCLARLERSVTLVEWTAALCLYPNPVAAAEAMIHLRGGVPVFLIVPLKNPTIQTAFLGGPPGEA